MKSLPITDQKVTPTSDESALPLRPAIYERAFDRLPFALRRIGRFLVFCRYRVPMEWRYSRAYEDGREPRKETWRGNP